MSKSEISRSNHTEWTVRVPECGIVFFYIRLVSCTFLNQPCTRIMTNLASWDVMAHTNVWMWFYRCHDIIALYQKVQFWVNTSIFRTAYYTRVSCTIEHQKQTCAVSAKFVCQYVFLSCVSTTNTCFWGKTRLYQMLIALPYGLVI